MLGHIDGEKPLRKSFKNAGSLLAGSTSLNASDLVEISVK
jgi:hypothetical protein